MAQERPLNFENAQQRSDWIIQHAEHFVAFRMLNRRRERQEATSLEEARNKAKAMLLVNNSKPILIYAVNGLSDTYIEMVKP